MQSWQDVAEKDIDRHSQANLEAIVQEALRLGINHFETARGYGSSERQLGYALRHLQRDRVLVQTKVAPHDDPAVFQRHLLDSIEKLQVGYLDLFAFHGLNTYRSLWQICRPGGCLAQARAMQRQGLVRWIGFSGHGPTEVVQEAIRHDGDGGFDYVNLHWYTIFQRHTPILAEARARDMGLFIISPTDKGGMLHTPPEKLRRLSAPLSPLQFNDLFCLSREDVHTISVGASRPEDFAEHVEALSALNDRAMIDHIYGQWQQAMRSATGFDRPDGHWSMYPVFDATPGFINIPYIFWLEHLVRGWDMLAFAKARYALLGKDLQWVPGNNAARVDEHDFSELEGMVRETKEDLVARLRHAHHLLR